MKRGELADIVIKELRTILNGTDMDDNECKKILKECARQVNDEISRLAPLAKQSIPANERREETIDISSALGWQELLEDLLNTPDTEEMKKKLEYFHKGYSLCHFQSVAIFR